MGGILRQALREDVPGIQRVRHSVRENVLTSTVISDADVLDAIERTARGWVVEKCGSRRTWVPRRRVKAKWKRYGSSCWSDGGRETGSHAH